MKLNLLCGVLWCGSFICRAGDEIRGIVTTVIDGNAIEVSAADDEIYKILLNGIDSPEPGQNYADQAKKYLEELLLNKSVTIVILGKDRKGNRLGEIHAAGTVDPAQALLMAGLAWTMEKEPNPDFESLKEQARASRKGLWQEANPTAPWIFRRQQTMMTLKSS